MASKKGKKSVDASSKAAIASVEDVLARIRRQIREGEAEGDEVLVLTEFAPADEKPETPAPKTLPVPEGELKALVREMLRAEIKAYLQQHLPALVAKIAREELEKIKKPD
jgi:cell pole-organizing protein PopZ